jgi:DNA-binding CsgD family transcriptional regulator
MPGERLRGTVGPTDQEIASSRELWDTVTGLELPFVLVDLGDFTVAAISEAASRRLGLRPAAVVGKPVVAILFDNDRMRALSALRAMRDGALAMYRADRRVRTDDHANVAITAWVRGFHFSDRSVALSELTDATPRRRSPLAEYLGQEPLTMVVGTTDADWVITSLSTDIEPLLGISAAEAVGLKFLCSLEQGDVRKVVAARGHAEGEHSVAVRVHLKDAAGAWVPFCCVLTALAGSTDLLFILLPEDELSARGTAMRAGKLEHHLVRIAAEIEASGVLHEVAMLPDPMRLPPLSGLTSRQWEVLRRLARGERVPTIAKALFVSQSTVRNHLAAIFERFQVHSQADLLERLQVDPRDQP